MADQATEELAREVCDSLGIQERETVMVFAAALSEADARGAARLAGRVRVLESLLSAARSHLTEADGDERNLASNIDYELAKGAGNG
jgi:hypothetical protein